MSNQISQIVPTSTNLTILVSQNRDVLHVALAGISLLAGILGFAGVNGFATLNTIGSSICVGFAVFLFLDMIYVFSTIKRDFQQEIESFERLKSRLATDIRIAFEKCTDRAEYENCEEIQIIITTGTIAHPKTIVLKFLKDGENDIVQLCRELCSAIPPNCKGGKFEILFTTENERKYLFAQQYRFGY